MSYSQTMRDLLCTAVQELLADYAITSHVTEDPTTGTGEVSLGGILGFTGKDMCGCVVITASPDTFATTNPTKNIPASSWCGELTNQIVGKFKAALYMRGVDVALSIPVVLSATRLSPQVDNAAAPVHLALPSGTLSLWLEHQGEPALQLREESSALCDVVMF